MLGELIGETTGRRNVKRVLETNPPAIKVSFESTGTVLGTAANGFATYTMVVRADGSLYGEGEGALMTSDGDMVFWKGSALGKIRPDRTASFRGIMYFQTASQKLARLNATPGVFEYEVDADGNTQTKVWEWK